MTTAARAQVMMNPATGRPVTAAQLFAAWLEQNEPQLFAALAERAGVSSGLGDWSSIISDIGSVASTVGSGLSSAASSVGDWLTTGGGAASLASLANTYLQSQASQSLTNLQIARAQQGLPPAPVSVGTTAYGSTVPVYNGASPPAGSQLVTLANGQQAYAMTTGGVSSLLGANWMQYLPWVLGLGALILLARA